MGRIGEVQVIKRFIEVKVPVVNLKLQNLYIVVVSVGPGIGRVNTVSRILQMPIGKKKTGWVGCISIYFLRGVSSSNFKLKR